MALKRPILVGGLGLSATLWLFGSAHVGLFDSSTLLSAIALGSGLWWWRHRNPDPAPARSIAPPVIDRARVEAQLTTLKALIETLTAEAALLSRSSSGNAALVRNTYEPQRQHLLTALDRDTLQVAVVGDRRTGKTTLITLLNTSPEFDATSPRLTFREVTLGPESSPEEEDLADDALLLITDGDLTDSTFTLLKQRVIAGQGVVLVFNKADHHDPADQPLILTQLQQRVGTLPVVVPVVQVTAAPRPLKVRRHYADGTVEERLELVEPAIAPLINAINQALMPEASTLVAATTLRQVEALRQQVQADLNGVRRQRAMPLIEQLQWIAAATAFANPVPTLDVLATVAINGQLIMDLGKLYGFNLSLEEAKTAAGILASLTVKLGLVELSTQVLTAVFKSHFATYLAGGTVQGLSAAYLTRMAGLSLIDYFEQATLAGTPSHSLSWEAIAQRLQTVIQQNRQLNLLQALVNQGISILKPAPTAVPLAAATTPTLQLTTPATSPEPITLDADSITA